MIQEQDIDNLSDLPKKLIEFEKSNFKLGIISEIINPIRNYFIQRSSISIKESIEVKSGEIIEYSYNSRKNIKYLYEGACGGGIVLDEDQNVANGIFKYINPFLEDKAINYKMELSDNIFLKMDINFKNKSIYFHDIFKNRSNEEDIIKSAIFIMELFKKADYKTSA